MQRGPVALFGAIVAVGVGPALWLGAQFGRFDPAPARSPAAVEQQHSDAAELMGGSGAGENQTGDDNDVPVRTTPRAHIIPLTTSPSASPSASADPSASASTPDDPSGSGPSDDQSASPSQSTDPSTGNGGGNHGSQPPPSPPTDGGSSSAPSGSGSGGSGGGTAGSGSDGGSGQSTAAA